jgi:hypothetical protein
MGYNTDLSGAFNLDKPLTADQVKFLTEFSSERHEGTPATGTTKFPGYYCQWVPTDDGCDIQWDGGEKFYAYTEWLEYLIKEFLIPWGYTLNGKVSWSGEDTDDQGYITVTNNEVRTKNTLTYIEELEEGITKILSLQPTVLPLLMGINDTMDQIVNKLLKGE